MRPLVHVGYTKCASTTLQAALFVPDAGFHPIAKRTELLQRLIMPLPTTFEPRPLAQRLADRIASAPSGAVPLVSHERLSGNPISGGHDAAELARRLREVVPDARVLVVVREQRAMLLSCYRHYVREGGPMSFADFVRPRTAARIPTFDPAFLEYDRLVRVYRGLFGPSAVCVLPMEWLGDHTARFVGSIADFAEQPRAASVELSSVRANAAEPAWSLAVTRWRNRVLHRSDLSPGAPIARPISPHPPRSAGGWVRRRVSDSVSARLRDDVDAYCADRYEHSNRRLAELVGLPLADLGYRM